MVGKAVRKFGVRSLLVLAVLAVRLVRIKKLTWVLGLANLWLLVGWVIGYWLTEIDDIFYVYISDPMDGTGQKVKALLRVGDLRRARELLVMTRSERQKLPVHNTLTGLVVAVLGIWVITSSGSILASGVALGLTTRLFIGLLLEKDFNKWYWVFAKKFTDKENRIVLMVWGFLLALQVLFLL